MYVVITMRLDFLRDCTNHPRLTEALNASEYLVPPMRREERREAIKRPARLFGKMITPRLVEKVLNDVGDAADQLPVLQHAMMRAWDRASKVKEIDLQHYETTGGARAALSTHANELYAALPSDDLRETTERLFKALSERAPDGRVVRRPCRRGLLIDLLGNDEMARKRLDRVIDQYSGPGRDFLLPLTEDGDDAVVDVSHEALFRNWDRLCGSSKNVGWLDEEAEANKRWISLVNQASLYQQDPQNMVRGAAFDQHQEWWDENQPTPAWVRLSRRLPLLEADSEFDRVWDLMNASRRQRKRELLRKRAGITAVPLAGVLAIGYFATSYINQNATIVGQRDVIACFGQLPENERVSLPINSSARFCEAILLRTSGNDAGAVELLKDVEDQELANRILSAQFFVRKPNQAGVQVAPPPKRSEFSNQAFAEVIAEPGGITRIEPDLFGAVVIESSDMYFHADPAISVRSSNGEQLATNDDGGEYFNFRIVHYFPPARIETHAADYIEIKNNIGGVGGFRITARRFEFNQTTDNSEELLAIVFSMARSSIQTPAELTEDIRRLLMGLRA